MSDNQILKIGGGKRQSNIEALRLVCMLMVLNLHSFKGYTHGEGILQFCDFFRESSSICAVNVFILISGYFGIKVKWKSAFNLLFQCAFYSFVVYGVMVLLGIIPLQINSLLKCFGCYILSWGFITNYIILYLLSPLLNKYCENSTKKELLIFIIALFVVENSVLITINILNFILLYMIGRLLRSSNLNQKYTGKPLWGYFICTVIISAVTFLLYKFTPIKTATMMTLFPLGFSYNSPFVILQAVFVFLVFARLQFSSRIVNWCATSCLAIFLIHMHPEVKPFYYQITESFYELTLLRHALYLVILIAVVFFGSILIDKLRLMVSECCYQYIANPLWEFLKKRIKESNCYNSIKLFLDNV